MILNLASAWKDLVGSGETFDKNDKMMFYTGAAAMLLILKEIEGLHSDNDAAMKVLMENIGEELKSFGSEVRERAESEI